MFDPEKVERFDYDDIHGPTYDQSGEFVNSSDYEALLVLYRELKWSIFRKDLERAITNS